MPTIEERLKDSPPRLIVLAACAFARTVEHLLTDERSRAAIEVAERFADGLATAEEVEAAVSITAAAVFAAEIEGRDDSADTLEWTLEAGEGGGWAAWAAAGAAAAAAEAAQTEGVAQRVVRAGWAADAAHAANKPANASEPKVDANQSILDCLLATRIQHPFPAHVKGLATTIYDNRDWSLMPILADALEEMGLEAFAQHCRQPIHAKGCHVLDSILGLH